MSDILTPDFWEGEDDAARREISPILARVYQAGANSGAAALPPGVEVLINWDAYNTGAVDWLRAYELRWLRGINQTTRRTVTGIMEDWVLRGDPMPVLEEKLVPIFGRRRAEMIASTEITRIYAEGNIAVWRSTGVVSGKVWQTAVDDKVCPICGPLHGRMVGLEAAWSMDAAGNIIENVGGLGLLAPPAHTRCRCWLNPVVSDAAFISRLDEAIRTMAGRQW